MAAFDYSVRFSYDTANTYDPATLSDAGGTLADADPGDTVLNLDETVSSDGPGGFFKGYLEFTFGGTVYRLLRVEGDGQTTFFGTLPPGVTAWFTDRYPSLEAMNDDWENLVQSAEDVMVCFAPGTLIATPGGERAVEALAPGDAVLTADGRTVAVRWMGRRTVPTDLAGERARPVRVRAGALAAGVPHADLVLTADHALILDGLAVNAGALVNGTTITLDPLDGLPPRVTYWHVETDAHETILANGAAAETFVDYVGRKAFDNHREYLALFGCERIIPESPLPRVSARRQLPAMLAARLGIASFADDLERDFAALMDAAPTA